MLTISASYGFALHLPLSATDTNLDDEPELSLSSVMDKLELRCCCYCSGGIHVDDTDVDTED